jgi:hypothetical protein
MITSASFRPLASVVWRAQPGNSPRLGHEHRGGDDAQLAHAEGRQDVVGGARHARVAHVTDDRDRKLRQIRLALQDGQSIQQPLGRVGHMGLSGREHAHMLVHMIGHQARDAFLGIADHQHVHVQGLERVDRVQHALALHARGQLQFQVDDIRAEPLGGELEGDAGAGRGFGEQIGHGDAREVP